MTALSHPALRAGLLAFAAAFPVMFAAPLLLRLVMQVERDYGALALWALALGIAGSCAAGFLGATVGARRALRRVPDAAVSVRYGAVAGAALLVLLLGAVAVVTNPAGLVVNGIAVVAAAIAAWFGSGRAVRRAGR